MIGDVVHYRHPHHGCVAAIVTSEHARGTVTLFQVETYRNGRGVPAGTLHHVPRGRRDAAEHWHPRSAECDLSQP